MTKPRVLDLFSGAGGAAMGYHLAGFEVVGVDIRPQARYPFEFHQADALTFPLDGFDLIHASPPCQAYTMLRSRHQDRSYPELIEPVRERLAASGVPYIIENVPGAPLHDPVMLCGTMFGLRTDSGELWRHRLFELSWRPLLLTHGCNHQARPIRCYGGGGLYARTGTPPLRASGMPVHADDLERRRPGATPRSAIHERRAVMGIDWMTRDELSQAIPPAYSRYLADAFLATRQANLVTTRPVCR